MILQVMPVASDDRPPIYSAQPKYLSLSHQLAARIRAREWPDGRVPTVREIAAQYNVSSFTASRALHLLQEKGLVVTKERSRCFVSPSALTTVERWGVVLRNTPGFGQEIAEHPSHRGFDPVAAEENAQFVRLPFDRDPLVALNAAAEADLRGILYLPSIVNEVASSQDTVFLNGCRKLGMPVVLIDRNLRGHDRHVDYDLVSADHFDGGRVCTEHLIGLGRRTIACAAGSPSSSHTDRLAGYLSALRAAREAGSWTGSPMVSRPPPTLAVREESTWLADRIQEQKVEAVICAEDDTAVGVMLELLRRGVRIPEDVAVVGCHDLPIGTTFSVGLTTYSYPAVEVTRWAVRLLRNRIARPSEPPARVLLRGQLVVRESTR